MGMATLLNSQVTGLPLVSSDGLTCVAASWHVLSKLCMWVNASSGALSVKPASDRMSAKRDSLTPNFLNDLTRALVSLAVKLSRVLTSSWLVAAFCERFRERPEEVAEVVRPLEEEEEPEELALLPEVKAESS